MKRSTLTFTGLLALGVAASADLASEMPVLTHDWPGYAGPNGTFTVPDQTPILAELKQAKLVWVNEQTDLGFAKSTSGGGQCYPKTVKASGSSSLIVAGGLVLLGYVDPKDEIVADDVIVAVDALTGKTKWKQVFAGKGLARDDRKHPRYGAVPVASGGKVFHLGSAGVIYAVNLVTGKPAWEADMGQFRQDLLAILKRTEGQPGSNRAAEVDKWWPYAMRGQLQVVDGVLLAPFGPWNAKDKHNPPKTPEESEARKRATLFAFDAATGKPLWNLVDGVGEGNTACAAKLGDTTYALTASKSGMLRLIVPLTGKVLWEEFLGVSHSMQPVMADGRVFVMRAKEPKKDTSEKEAFLAAFTLSETGPKLAWQSPQALPGPAGWNPIAYRQGIIYAGLQGGVFALDAATGKELGCLAGERWLFHLWGDRLVIPGDVNHESMGLPCTYTAVTPGVKDLKLAGAPFAFRDVPGYKGVCGYEVLMIHPFVDGYLFTRAVDVKKGVGVIMCWDLRQPVPAQR
jgi:outer membrane protein assembly factor BamB